MPESPENLEKQRSIPISPQLYKMNCKPIPNFLLQLRVKTGKKFRSTSKSIKNRANTPRYTLQRIRIVGSSLTRSETPSNSGRHKMNLPSTPEGFTQRIEQTTGNRSPDKKIKINRPIHRKSKSSPRMLGQQTPQEQSNTSKCFKRKVTFHELKQESPQRAGKKLPRYFSFKEKNTQKLLDKVPHKPLDLNVNLGKGLHNEFLFQTTKAPSSTNDNDMETRNMSIQTMKSDEHLGKTTCLYNILNTVINSKKENFFINPAYLEMKKFKSLKIEGTSSHLQSERHLGKANGINKEHLQNINETTQQRKPNVFNNIHIRAALNGGET